MNKYSKLVAFVLLLYCLFHSRVDDYIPTRMYAFDFSFTLRTKENKHALSAVDVWRKMLFPSRQPPHNLITAPFYPFFFASLAEALVLMHTGNREPVGFFTRALVVSYIRIRERHPLSEKLVSPRPPL